MKPITSPKLSTAAFYSPGIDLENGVVMFSGQVALTSDGEFINTSFDAEVDQVFFNIDTLLEASNLSKKNIVKATVYLSNIDDYAEMNTKYMEYMRDHAPARTCIQVGALPLGAKIEIEIIAMR